MSLYEHERSGDAEAIVETLESGSASVRRRAAELLGEFDGHDRREDVIDALVVAATDDDDRVAAAAVDALDRLGDGALDRLVATAAGIELDDAADWQKAEAFVAALESDRPELRMAAANALGELGQPEAVSALADRFDDPDPRVRARAARACGQIGDPRATTALEGLLGDSSGSVRRAAAEALGRIGGRRALAALLELYDDPDPRVRRIAVGGLGAFDTDRPVDALAAALTDESGPVRRAAVFSLLELLSNVPGETSHELRETVLAELAATDDETITDPLVEILAESSQATQRRNTAWLLGRLLDDDADREAVDALIEALADGEQMTRQFAATSLAEIGGTRVERELLALAEDPDLDETARGQALFALGRVGDEETATRIETLVDETDSETVRKRAFSALSKLGGRR